MDRSFWCAFDVVGGGIQTRAVDPKPSLLACPDKFQMRFGISQLSKKHSFTLITPPESKTGGLIWIFLITVCLKRRGCSARCVRPQRHKQPFLSAPAQSSGDGLLIKGICVEQKSCGPYVLMVLEGGASASWPGGHQQGVTGFSDSNHGGEVSCILICNWYCWSFTSDDLTSKQPGVNWTVCWVKGFVANMILQSYANAKNTFCLALIYSS